MHLAKKLNLSRPYGTVSGLSFALFEQNGILYNGDGCAIDLDGNLLPMEKSKPEEKSKPDIKAPVEPFAIDPEDEIEEGIDLRGWADGVVSYPWGTVTAAIQRQFDVVAKNKKEAIEVVNKMSPAKPTVVGTAA